MKKITVLFLPDFMLILFEGCGMFGRKPVIIVYPENASPREIFAALREIRRYIYLRSGRAFGTYTLQSGGSEKS